MDREVAEKLIDSFALMSIAMDKIGKDIGGIKSIDERKEIGPLMKELLLSYFNFRDKVGFEHPEIHPDYLGKKNWHELRKKYETSEVQVKMPTQEEIDEAAKLWGRLHSSFNKGNQN